MNIRDMIADVFATHGIGEIDIAVLPRIIDDLTTKIEEFVADQRDEARTEGMIAEREVHFG